MQLQDTVIHQPTNGRHALPLTRYLERLSSPRALLEDAVIEADIEPAADGAVRGLAKRVLPLGVRVALRERWRTAITDALRPYERRRARALADSGQAVRLHLGSGYLHKDGWVNVDLAVIPAPVELRWNLVHPLPFEDGTVDAIFHEHLLEHIPAQFGMQLLRDSHRVLKPGGVLRVGVPDAGAYLRDYASGGGGIIDRMRPGRPTPMLAVQEVFYRYNHRTMFDGETLVAFCLAAGFEHAEVKAFGESTLSPCPDSEERRAESVYVEAYKGGDL